MKILPQSFYNRPTLKVARDLLGQFLVSEINRTRIIGKITEVEAYVGPNDRASHASRGLTPRTKIMFGSPGFWYVYLIYGMYHCLNVVTERSGFPAAVLIRGTDLEDADGPGKLCREFKISRASNGLAAFKKPLYIAAGPKPRHVYKGPRIGVDYAGPYRLKPWRFYIKNSI